MATEIEQLGNGLAIAVRINEIQKNGELLRQDPLSYEAMGYFWYPHGESNPGLIRERDLS